LHTMQVKSDLCRVKIEGLDKYVYIHPDTNFWAYADESEEKDVIRKFLDVKDRLEEEMRAHRFGVNVRTAYVNVTDRCNADCPYCYIPREIRKHGRTMSREELEEILNLLMECGVEWVIFHGAEPLMAKDMVFDAIDDFPLNFGIQTNGFLLEEDDARFLMSRGVNLGISFDSPVREVEDYLRGRGHYDKVMEIIKFMKGYEKFSVITTITARNCSHLSEMVDLLAGKVPVVLMNVVRGTSAGGREMRVNAAREFIRAVERAIEHTKAGKRIVIGDFANYLLGIAAPSARVLQCDVSPCGAARRFVAVATDGFYPCSEFIGLKEFRYRLASLTKAGFNSMLEKFECVRERIVERIPECRECVFRNICGSPCPAEVYSEFGTFFAKSPSCDYYKPIIEHAFRVLIRGNYRYVLRTENLRRVY